jgi:hypothetical protein
MIHASLHPPLAPYLMVIITMSPTNGALLVFEYGRMRTAFVADAS